VRKRTFIEEGRREGVFILEDIFIERVGKKRKMMRRGKMMRRMRWESF